MGREYPEYRDVLADLIETFDGRAWITLREIAQYDGCCTRTARKRYGIPASVMGINRNVLARRICMLAR